MNWILTVDNTDLPDEVWKEIPGYEERYEVSSFGRVKSWVFKKPQILRKTLSAGKYKVLLYKKRGKYENASVGRLVASAFIRMPNENEVLRYKDGNCLKDFADNVYWDTRKSVSNIKNSGCSNGMAKLDEKKVREIKACLKAGQSMNNLAEKYNIAYSTIRWINSGRIWRHV
ncbi:NUMOD4 domain-containing protein [uncultured Chryseobacterium sp.]|uniref:NUMOD4 domain-containing protein n=1 Tax=uncultured Chryseobacterium sp. TaxID=259322 RepID=UPI0025D4DC26|nr:NUMOD4 domain-containing protein [uncultured Chryseobacterium sp.]